MNQAPDSSPASILIVEDELIVAESLSLDLQRKGYAIAGIVSSGEEAIDAIERMQPDLILMDIMLKGFLDGIETNKVIQHRASVPIIYITAFSDRATLDRAKQAGEPLHYMVKPIRLKDLVKMIETVLTETGSSKALSSSTAPLTAENYPNFPQSPTSEQGRIQYSEIDLSFFDVNG
jgi:DNA-binding response OmpR family regulator